MKLSYYLHIIGFLQLKIILYFTRRYITLYGNILLSLSGFISYIEAAIYVLVEFVVLLYLWNMDHSYYICLCFECLRKIWEVPDIQKIIFKLIILIKTSLIFEEKSNIKSKFVSVSQCKHGFLIQTAWVLILTILLNNYETVN